MLGPGNTGPNKTCPQAALCQSDGGDRQVNKYSTVCSVLTEQNSGVDKRTVELIDMNCHYPPRINFH